MLRGTSSWSPCKSGAQRTSSVDGTGGGVISRRRQAGLDGKGGSELLQKMSEGIFTLRDMYEQFSNIMKMGAPASLGAHAARPPAHPVS